MIRVVLPALVAALLAVQPPRPFADERHLLDRRLETLRRILPDGPTPSADILHVRDLAEAARLERVEVQARTPVESGASGEVSLDVSALGGYEEVDRFFQKVALSQRLVDVERLTLTGTTEDVVQLAVVLRFPYWPAHAPLPPPPESPWGRPAGVPRPALDAYRHDRQVALAKSDAIASRRRSRRSPRLFLSELAAAARDRPVILGYAELNDDLAFTLRGIAVGQGPLRAFESRLERGFFRMSDFLIAKQGACHRFEAHGRSPVAGPDAELPVPMEDPFEPDETPCRVDRDQGRTVVVKGRTPTAKDPGHGPITLRLRDLDLTDVFQVIATLGAGAFVVDDDVVGRASVEVTRATLDETLAAIRKSAGVEIAGGHPVWRVSTSRKAPRPGTAEGGPPASFALKRTDVRDLLAAMADVDPALAALGPPGFLGRVSVWTKDVPLLAVRGAVLDAAGLTERSEGDTRIVDRPSGSGDTPSPVARTGSDPRLALRPEELTFQEFELAGVASGGGPFVAFAYSPTGRLNAYRPGERLFDALVRAVESTDVLLETSDGPLQIPVPPMPD
jgi:hypothetical protein